MNNGQKWFVLWVIAILLASFVWTALDKWNPRTPRTPEEQKQNLLYDCNINGDKNICYKAIYGSSND